MTTMGSALKQVFDTLNINRMQTGKKEAKEEEEEAWFQTYVLNLICPPLFSMDRSIRN